MYTMILLVCLALLTPRFDISTSALESQTHHPQGRSDVRNGTSAAPKPLLAMTLQARARQDTKRTTNALAALTSGKEHRLHPSRCKL
jgi:hypothetical protein